MKWGFSNGYVSAGDNDRILIKGIVPGYRNSERWISAGMLSVVEEGIAYSDKTGKGHAMLLSCKLGLLDGSLRLINYDNGSLGCQIGLTNNIGEPVILGKYAPVMTCPGIGSICLTGHPAEWRVYIDSGSCGGKCASYGLNENEGIHTAGAVSVLWSPGYSEALAVGQVEVERSWTEIVYRYGGKGKSMGKPEYQWANYDTADFSIRQDAQGYRLDPGETLFLDQCLFVLDKDPFKALIELSDAMIVFNNVRKFTNEDVWVGWMTWYNQEKHIQGSVGGGCKYDCASEEVTLKESRFMKESGLQAYGVRDIEIDDGFQKEVHLGDWLETTPMFPSGMDGLAKELKSIGMRPGVWLTPFVATEDSTVFKEHPEWFAKDDEGKLYHAWDWYHANPAVRAYNFDPTAPGAIEWLINVYKTFQKWGYWAFKNDFSGELLDSEGKQYYNCKQTCLMRWRWTWKKIKEALGGDGKCSIQPCGANNVSGIGIFDTVRTGSDVCPGVSPEHWNIIKNDTSMTGINRWWQNKRFFVSDPDNLEVAEYKDYKRYKSVADFEHKWALSFDEAHVRAVIVFACGGNIILGDRLTLLEPERIDIIKKVLPLYGVSAIPLDMFHRTVPHLLWNHIEKPWGSWEVLSVINYEENAIVEEILLKWMHLEPEADYIVWELWSEQVLDVIRDGVLRAVVKPHSVKTMRITQIKRGNAEMVGSSFHISMGGVEADKMVRKADGALQICITRPAAEEGRCYFWSAGQKKVVCIPVRAGPEGANIENEIININYSAVNGYKYRRRVLE